MENQWAMAAMAAMAAMFANRYPRNVAPCGGNDLKSEQRRRSRQSKSQIENSEVTSQKKNRKKQ
jgi:hypothetical protein